MSYVLPCVLIFCKYSWSLFNMHFYHDNIWPVIKAALVLNSDILGSFKKFPLLFRQAKIIFVIIWLTDHFTLKPVPSVNGVWIITFINHLHVCVMKFKPSRLFFQLLILMKHSTLSEHPRRATFRFAMSSSISLLSLKIFC